MQKRPLSSEYPSYYEQYIKLVPEGNIIEVLDKQTKNTFQFLSSIVSEKHSYNYADGKWSTKEIVGHLCDVERVFAYRALRFSRKDFTELPGFDENDYVGNSNFKDLNYKNLVDQLYLLRCANIAFFGSFTDDMWKQIGIANGNTISVYSIPFILVGHEIHHLNIIKVLYL